MAGFFTDYRQDEAIHSLANEMEASVDAFATLSNGLERERRRNDLQTERIKALATAVEALYTGLISRGLVPAEEVAAPLAELRAAMAPRSLK